MKLEAELEWSCRAGAPHAPEQPKTTKEILRLAPLPQDDRRGSQDDREEPNKVLFRGCFRRGFRRVLDGRIKSHQRKIAETLEFPRFFGRADRI